MPTRTDLVQLMNLHIGRDHGMTAAQLAQALVCPPRRVRQLVSEARENGVAICGHPKTGYFLANTADELDETCRFLRARALHSLTLEARLRRVKLAELIGQLSLPIQ
ncbi:MAG: hypothetical protein VB141_12995 [Burkholderia gladioli]